MKISTLILTILVCFSTIVDAQGTQNRANELMKQAQSSLEQKEYEVIDEEIAALEQKIAKLDSEIEMAATQYSRLTELTQEKSELEQLIR